MDPIQVWENHAGPIPTDGGLTYYAYIAYRDPEADAEAYGYGRTPEQAMEDYIRQEAETHCSNCTECSCEHECILFEPNFSTYLKGQAVFQMMPENDQSHREWREINGLPSY